MGTTRNLIRVASAKCRQTALLVLATFIGWTSAAQLLACTPAGVHCPTAPIQSVSKSVKSCCGSVVRLTSRKPQLGDKGFVQCRCAEKRSTQQQVSLDQGAIHIEMLAAEPFVLTIPLLSPEAYVTSTDSARTVRLPLTPLVPPPSIA